MFSHRPLPVTLLLAGLLISISAALLLAVDQTADQLYQQGVKQLQQGDYAAAKATFRRVDPLQLTKEQRISYYATLQELDRRMQNKVTPADLLAQAQDAQKAGQLAQAVTLYQALESNPAATASQKQTASARLAEARRDLNVKETQARQNIDQALTQIQAGQLDDAEKTLTTVKDSGLDLGWFDNERVASNLTVIAQRRAQATTLAAVTPAPVATPVKPVAVPAAKPVPAPAPAVAAMPAPVLAPAPAPVKPVEITTATPVAIVAPKPAPVAPTVAVKPSPAPVAAPVAAVAPVAVVAATPAPTPVPAAAPAQPPATPTIIAKPAPVATAAPAPTAKPTVNADLLQQARLLYAQQKLAEGQTAEQSGQLHLAVKSYQEGLAADPQNATLKAALDAAQIKQQQAGGHDILDTQIADQQLVADATVAEFAASLNLARELLLKNNFTGATEMVQQAKLTLDRKQTILPTAKYEDLRKEAANLAAQIADAQRVYQAKQLVEIENERKQEAVAARTKVLREQEEEVQKLLRRAADLRREQKYDKSLEYLNQALFLDPNNVAAQAMKEMIEDTMTYVRYREGERKRAVKIAQQSVENLEATIPYTELMTYPSDWPELTYRRLKGMSPDSGEGEVNRRVSQKLKEPVPINFEGNKLVNVIDYLRNTTGLNFAVNWGALEQAGVPQDKPITLQLVNVPAQEALRRVLQQASTDDANAVTFSIIEGIVTISTSKDLTRTTETRVYDIRDLLVNVPNYDNAPDFDLANSLSATSFGKGGGGGGGKSPFTSTSTTTTAGTGPTRAETIQQITTLIQDTVGRSDEWADRGGNVSSLKELNGNLIVKTTPENHRHIIQLLMMLRETRAMQISVEGRFLLVDQNFLDDVNVNLGFGFTPDDTHANAVYFQNGTRSIVTGQALTTNIPGSFTSSNNSSPFTGSSGSSSSSVALPANPSQTIGGVIPGGVGPWSYVFNDWQVSVMLQATQAKRNAISLTAPRVTFFNGQKAYVMVSRQITYVSNLTPVPNAAGFDTTLSVVNVGVVLKVEGTISADRRYVTMSIEPSLSTLARIRQIPVVALVNVNNGNNNNNNGGFLISGTLEAPEIELTQVKTTVSVPDRGTLLLGGQRLVGEVSVEAGVPVLSKIPVLNRFFTNNTEIKDERTLLILVKPTIIIQSEEEDNLFPGLMQDPGRYNVGRGSAGNAGVSGIGASP